MTQYNRYTNTAEFYDKDDRVKTKDEIKFYSEILRNFGGEVLELGCGTGRLTILLAKSGIKITGLDISESMLSVFREKIKSLNYITTKNISLVHANMVDFIIEKKFNYIFIPFSGFQALTDDTDILTCLLNVYRHLTTDGIFILHVFNPAITLDENWEHKDERADIILKGEDGTINFKRTYVNKKNLVNEQVVFTDWFFYTYNEGQLENSFVEHFKLKYYYENELQNLLETTGFEIINRYGYYDKRKITDEGATEMIFVCKKKHNICKNIIYR